MDIIKIIDNLGSLFIGIVSLIYVLICVPILEIILIIGFFMPVTLSFKQGWNLKYKLTQFKNENKGIFEAFWILLQSYEVRKMDENKYMILRLLFPGLGMGIFAGITISTIVGITWFVSYFLCWSFSFIYIKYLRKEIAKSKTQGGQE